MATKKIKDYKQATTANDTDVMILESAPETQHVTFLTLVNKIKEKLGIASINSQLTQLNSNLLLINADSDTSEGSSFNKNFLLTGSATPGATPQRSAYFSKPADDTDWVNIPTTLQGKLWVGYRQVYRRSSVNILIRIIEMYPIPGRTWNNFYNNGAWTGWKSISPQ